MDYNGKKIWTEDDFEYNKVEIGDYVTADVVMNAMDCLPPACMRLTCSQMGEPYSHRQDPENGLWRPTYATFKCVEGDYMEGVWMYCGHCFRGETEERGEEPVYA